MPELPPWLDITPAQFGQAAAEGARINLERAHLQQSAAQAAAQLSMESQRLAASERQAAMEAQIHRETLAANFQRAQTQAAITQAYHQATLGLAKNRLDLEGQKLKQTIQDKAAELTDRQGYAMSIAGGMKPAEALAKYPRAWSPSLAASGAKTPEETISRRTKIAGEEPVAAQPAKGMLWWKTPAVTAKAGTPEQYITESVKAPPGTTPAAAFATASPGSAGVPPAPGTPGTAPASPLSPAQKVALANKIAEENPDWTKQQVLAEVNSRQ